MHSMSRLALKILSAIVALSACGAQTQRNDAALDKPRVGVIDPIELVVLNFNVVDRGHQPVTGLEFKDLTVYEDGQPQRIKAYSVEESPVSVGLVVDGSASMLRHREVVTRAVTALLDTSNPEDEFFVVNFSDAPHLDQDFTRDHDRISQALTRATGGQGTALYDAVNFSAAHSAKSSKWGRRVLVLIADGVDNGSHLSLEQIVRMIQDIDGPTVYSIGILNQHADRSRGRATLEQLSKETGALAQFPENETSIVEAARQVAKDIRSQFFLGYRPPNGHLHAGCHKVKVVAHVSGEDLDARTRTVYCIPGQEGGGK